MQEHEHLLRDVVDLGRTHPRCSQRAENELAQMVVNLDERKNLGGHERLRA
ncbi:MAG: hypothetical protein ACE37F_02940 [Nannocystaceae bacterium]|nr:hypothetical protein [bacterium]